MNDKKTNRLERTALKHQLLKCLNALAAPAATWRETKLLLVQQGISRQWEQSNISGQELLFPTEA